QWSLETFLGISVSVNQPADLNTSKEEETMTSACHLPIRPTNASKPRHRGHRRDVMSAIFDIVRSAIFVERGEGNAEFSIPRTSIHTIEADGVRVFYRAAGDTTAPVVLLLHGFPASSFMFRELIPRLADRYRVIAPDLPGFGFTEVPSERKY